MDKKFAIFDMDGTLVDSMGYWQGLAVEYLKQRGIDPAPADILERIKPLTMPETSALFIREFGFPGTPETVAGEVNAVMEEHYRRDILLKPGVKDYLDALRERGARMCVASATTERLVALCLERLGVLGHFEFLISCERVGTGKTRPDVYHAASDRLGGKPHETAVYEDAIYAARTARDAGYYVVGVYDPRAKARWEEMTGLAHEVIVDWGEKAKEFIA